MIENRYGVVRPVRFGYILNTVQLKRRFECVPFHRQKGRSHETIGVSRLRREPNQAHIEVPKTSRMPMSISVIEQAKIQAQVLVPLVKALQAELGEAPRERAGAQGAGRSLSRLRRSVLDSEERGQFGPGRGLRLQDLRA